MLKKKERPHYYGHRQRLKDRLRENPRGLADYEVLELLLSYANPRRDNKPLAKALMEQFQTVRGVFMARPAQLKDVDGFGEGFEQFWLLWREFWARVNEQAVAERAVVNNPKDVAELAKARLGPADSEEFWLALVDNQNRLIGWEQLSRGTVDQAAVYPREVLSTALVSKASGIVLVHNHPGGDPQPSRQDKELTRRIKLAAHEIGIRILDHLIVTDNEFFSFKNKGLL
ncbi:RadC family protein [Desulfovibrio inopinatus]|uniref:RadC family protein n=1 Tax=Desulfovibrio inopinatus TaxID=102109 RepID=UPI00040A8203|nr:DNA repair protein RadC [Desulfovibrio inopinatus]